MNGRNLSWGRSQHITTAIDKHHHDNRGGYHGEEGGEVGHVSEYSVDDGHQLRVVVLKGSVWSHVFDDVIQ